MTAQPKKICKIERGYTARDDRLPEWRTREPLRPHNSVFGEPEEELYRMFKESD